MNEGMGPSIWLAGDPADLKKWMNSGIEGIVTNTVVQRELTEKYGSLINLTKEYLDITDKKIYWADRLGGITDMKYLLDFR